METYYSEGANAHDLNQDGQLDVVYGPYWYAGPDFKNPREIYPAKPQNIEGYADSFFSWIHDVDKDGLNDVVMVGLPGTPAFVFQNPGIEALKEGKPWKRHQVADSIGNESPHFIQLTGDETPELVCTVGGRFGFLTVDSGQPLGKWQFHMISERPTADRFGHGLGVGDVNGDSRLDILSPEGWYEQPAKDATVARWPFHGAKFTSAYGGAEMYAYDVDGDGDSDVITSLAAHDFGLAWYEQQVEGGESVFREHLIVGSQKHQNKYGIVFSEPHSVALADIDGDGLKDIITGKTYYSHHKGSPMWDAGAVVYWFKLVRGADGIDWVPYLADKEAGIGRQISIVDVNQDKLPDIVVGGMKGGSVLIHQAKSVSAEEYAAAQPKVYDGPRPKPFARGPRSLIDPLTGKVARAQEGESLKVLKVSRGTAEPQKMNGFPADAWSGDSQLWWTGGKPGDQLELEIEAPADGEFEVQVVLSMARDYGVVQASVDGQKLGAALDLYNSPDVITTGVLSLGQVKFQKGPHKIAFTLLDPNPAAAPANMVGVDYLRLVTIDPSTSQTEALDKANLGFENGKLEGWKVEGKAFAGQPIEGDTVSARRSDMASGHEGKFWIGTYEKLLDEPQGTLTSSVIEITQPWCSFLVGGGETFETRVELVRPDTGDILFRASGRQDERMRRVVVDLRGQVGKPLQIRVIDASSGGWGHINFDDFRFHAEAPGRPERTLGKATPDEYPYGGQSGEDAAKNMIVPEGFTVTLAAGEPQIQQPIAMCYDDRGRLWVVEGHTYPRRAPEGTGKDRILIFEDQDGDGKFDSRKVFIEGLNLVSGIEFGFGGIWVGAAPYLMFIPDRNQDDVPDAVSEAQPAAPNLQPLQFPKDVPHGATVLLDGWHWEDTHETLNAFIWGPDGWLYGCHGVFTHSKVGKPGTPDNKRQPLNAGIWRYHPTRHEFEVFAHGTSNPWGVDFNDFGEAFCTACVIPHLYHIIPGGRYQRQAGNHFNPHTYDDIKTIADHLHYLGANPHGGNGRSDEAGGGHAHAGAMIYLGGTWPAKFRNMLFMNNIHGQRLNMDIPEAQGSGYVGRHGPDFLLTGDRASQMLNLRYGPDGNAYVIDWYDMQACHLDDPTRHDRTNGRIYKISYTSTNKKQASPADLAAADDLKLAEQVLNSNDWYVRHARRMLQERSTERAIAPNAVEFLRTTLATHADVTRRLRALWVLHCIKSATDDASALSSNDPHLRAWGVRLLAEQPASVPADFATTLADLASKDVQPVRLSIASALQRLPLNQRWSVLERLVSHPEDASDHNLPLMYWYAAEPLADADSGRAMALGMLAKPSLPKLSEFMLRRIGSDGGPKAIAALVDGIAQAKDDATRLLFLRAVRSSLQGQPHAEAPAAWATVGPTLLASQDPAIHLQAAALGATFQQAAAADELRKIAIDPKRTASDREEALSALLSGRAANLSSTLVALLNDQELRPSAIRGLSLYEDSAATQAILELYAQLTPDEQRMALGTLCSRLAPANALMDAIAAKSIPASHLTADLVRQLTYLKNKELDQRVADIWGSVRETAADKVKMIAEYKTLVEDAKQPAADAALGRAVFTRTCQNCHTLYGVGGKVGPDLTGSNRANLDYLLTNIVDPSAVMAKEYQPTIITTVDGRVLTGIVRGEDARSVTLQSATEFVVVPKTEVEERVTSPQSMMPENQLKQFTPHEVRSLVTYLRGKTQTPIRATNQNLATLFNGRDLTGWSGNSSLWSVENGQIVGRTTGLKHNEFLVSDLLLGDFDFTCEVQLVKNEGNSGIQFRSSVHIESDKTPASVSGYQADIGAGWWGKLYEEHGRALIWDKSGEQHIQPGEWTTYRIRAQGNHVQTWLNGQLCVDLKDDQGAREGIMAIQLHSGGPTEVRYRNLQVQLLPAAE